MLLEGSDKLIWDRMFMLINPAFLYYQLDFSLSGWENPFNIYEMSFDSNLDSTPLPLFYPSEEWLWKRCLNATNLSDLTP